MDATRRESTFRTRECATRPRRRSRPERSARTERHAMFSHVVGRTPESADDRYGRHHRHHRQPFEELSNRRGTVDGSASRASTVELKRGGTTVVGADFVETPEQLRRRVESIDAAFGTVRRTEDATPVSFEDGRAPTEEFDRRGALTPYLGGGRRFEATTATTAAVTDSVEPIRRVPSRVAHGRGDAGRGDARGAVLEVLLWKDAARSAIHFTLGMTILLGCRLVPRSTVSGVSVASYTSMAYIVYKYVWAVMFPRLSYGLKLDAQSFGDAAERMAHGFNVWAARHHGVLAGRDNKAVFRTFLALYAVSSLGHVMSAWAVATTLWVGAFTLPPLFDAYKYPLMNTYFNVYVFFSARFNALSAPKRWIGGLLIGVATFACVSARARFCLSFLALVAFRMFRDAHVKEIEAFENIVRSAGRRVSRSMNDFAMIVSPVVRHRRR